MEPTNDLSGDTASTDFAKFIASTDAVRFGDFTLKSGKKSEVFFNFGGISDGASLKKLGEFFASFLVNNSLVDVDAIFGPAYKGINIALATSIALSVNYDITMPFAYNRKIEKDHAEGGRFVGINLATIFSAVVVDDVITDGGTKYETIKLLRRFPNLRIAGFVVGVDREELSPGGVRWAEKLVAETGIPFYALTTMKQVLNFRG